MAGTPQLHQNIKKALYHAALLQQQPDHYLFKAQHHAAVKMAETPYASYRSGLDSQQPPRPSKCTPMKPSYLQVTLRGLEWGVHCST
jgi:hypothetical protein